MIIHCLKCSNIIAKGFTELEEQGISFSYETKCPYCKDNVIIAIEFKTIVVVNGEVQGARKEARIRALGNH